MATLPHVVLGQAEHICTYGDGTMIEGCVPVRTLKWLYNSKKLNVAKSECLPVASPPPPPPSLPKYAHPPDPVQAGPDLWSVLPSESYPEWADP